VILNIIFLSVPILSMGESTPKVFYYEGPKTEKQIALTFDDGPGPHTQEFLDLLDRYKVKATFFMLGELAEFRGSVAKEVLTRGHEVGNHTFNHKNYLKELKDQIRQSNETKENHPHATAVVKKELLEDMNKSRAVIEKAIGKKLTICRMPHGVDATWVHEVARDAGFILVNWTYGADWTKASAEELIPSYIKAIRPGAILLLHDGGNKREKTLQITEAVIKAAQEKGYKMVTVTELLKLK